MCTAYPDELSFFVTFVIIVAQTQVKPQYLPRKEEAGVKVSLRDGNLDDIPV